MKIMKKILDRRYILLRGAGSTLELMPKTYYTKYVPTENVKTRVGRNFEKTGNYVARSIRDYAKAESNS